MYFPLIPLQATTAILNLYEALPHNPPLHDSPLLDFCLPTISEKRILAFTPEQDHSCFFAALIALYQKAFFYQVIDVAECGELGGFAVFGPFCRCESPPSNPSHSLLTRLN